MFRRRFRSAFLPAAILLAFCPLSVTLFAQTAPPKFATLYAFDGYVNAGDGIDPTGSLLVGADGVLYGVTYEGGISSSQCPLGCGTVFSLTPAKHGRWKETQIHRFTNGSDGSAPDALTISPDGVLYGTTSSGGSTACGGTGCGTAFSLTPPNSQGGAWDFTAYAFHQNTVLADGLHLGANGLLLGTSLDGGNVQTCFYGCGGFFELKPPAEGDHMWREKILYSFSLDHRHPIMTVNGRDGLIYGTSEGGDSSCPFGCGIVFQMTPPETKGGAWKEIVLDAFINRGSHPFGPASVVLGSDGVVYGASYDGGEFNLGAVFSLTPPAVAGDPWTETLLYSFSGPPDAANPNTGLAIGNDGTLYGTTFYGGDASCQTLKVGCGAVFSLKPPSSPGGSWTETVLHAFTGGADGGNPRAGVTVGPNGVLYGTTSAFGGSGKYGTVFALMP